MLSVWLGLCLASIPGFFQQRRPRLQSIFAPVVIGRWRAVSWTLTVWQTLKRLRWDENRWNAYLKKIKHGTRSSLGSIWWRRGFSMAVWKLCKEAHLSVYAAIASICFFLTIKRTKRHMWTGRCCIFRIPACNDTIESGRRWRQYLGFPHPVRGKHHVWMVDRSGQSHVFRCLSPLEIERFWKRLGRTFGSLMQSQSIAMLWIFIVIYSYHVDMYTYHEKV